MPLTRDELLEFIASLPWKYNAQGYAIIKRSHVVLWADGRKIEPKQIAHHINENKSDDRPENLQVVSWKEHAAIHRLQERGGKSTNKHSPERREDLRRSMTGNQYAKGVVPSAEKRQQHSEKMKEIWRKRRAGELPMPDHKTIQ